MNYFNQEAAIYAAAQTAFAAMGHELPESVKAKLREAHTLLHDAYFELTRLEKEDQNEDYQAER